MLIVCLCGILYLTVALAAILRFGRRAAPLPQDPVGITVLKPVHGLEAELFENLCSFCEQEYPQFQVIFGVGSADDPAIGVIRRVMERFPERDLSLAIGDRSLAGNPKVANLQHMSGDAKYDLLIAADADMRVERHYLAAIRAEFSSPDIGAVTCLYSGLARGGLSSDLSAMQLNEHFAPSVLVATLKRAPQFCFGSTMAVRREALESIGGFAALAPHLADDYMLGALVDAHGYRVVLARYVARNVVSEPGLGALLRHEVRWARTIRMQRPLGYALSFVTFPLPFAVLLALFFPSTVAWVILIAVVALRGGLHVAVARALRLAVMPPLWLVPLRDGLSLLVWAIGLFGNTVRWRDRTIAIGEGGHIAAGPGRARSR